MFLQLIDLNTPDPVSPICALDVNQADEIMCCLDDGRMVSLPFGSSEFAPVHKLSASHNPLCIDRSRANPGASVENYVVGTSSGSLRLLLRERNSLREKQVAEAHKAAILCVKWNHEGSSIASGDEEGVLSLWSRNGEFRQNLVTPQLSDQTGPSPIFSLAWDVSGDNVVATQGAFLEIFSAKSGQKIKSKNFDQRRWKAHDSPILCVGWAVDGTIISGGEDKKIKLWDFHGRQIGSINCSSTVTSLTLSPVDKSFVAATRDRLILCSGPNGVSTCSLELEHVGAIYDLDFSSKGNMIVAGSARGSVLRVSRFLEPMQGGAISLQQVDQCVLRIGHNLSTPPEDEIEFRSPILAYLAGWDYAIVATTEDLHFFEPSSSLSPSNSVSIQLGVGPRFLAIAEKTCCVSDGRQIVVLNQTGRPLSTIPQPPVIYGSDQLKLGTGFVAVACQKNRKAIKFFDVNSGRPLGQMNHSSEISLPFFTFNKMIAFLDGYRDLWLCNVSGKFEEKKRIANSVDAHFVYKQALFYLSHANVFECIAPVASFVDVDLASQVMVKLFETSTNVVLSSIIDASPTSITCLKTDGARHYVYRTPANDELHEFARMNRWNSAINLCRMFDSESLWAGLAVLAMSAPIAQLEAAQIAYSSLGIVDKVDYIQSIRNSPPELRNVELALLKHQPAEAESILLAEGKMLEALQLNIRLYQWKRAIELARQMQERGKTDSMRAVVDARQQYLDSIGLVERDELFLSLQ